MWLDLDGGFLSFTLLVFYPSRFAVLIGLLGKLNLVTSSSFIYLRPSSFFFLVAFFSLSSLVFPHFPSFSVFYYCVSGCTDLSSKIFMISKIIHTPNLVRLYFPLFLVQSLFSRPFLFSPLPAFISFLWLKAVSHYFTTVKVLKDGYLTLWLIIFPQISVFTLTFPA